MDHEGNVIDELSADHRAIANLFHQIETLPPGDTTRKRYAEQAVITLVSHAVVEEQYFYPAVRLYLHNGDALVDKGIDDHARIERLLRALEHIEADDPQFESLLKHLIGQVRGHIQDEVRNIFPPLRDAATAQTLTDLGETMRRAKKTASTRLHSS